MSQPIHGQGAGVPAAPQQTDDFTTAQLDQGEARNAAPATEPAPEASGEASWRAGDVLSSREPGLIADEAAPLGDELVASSPGLPGSAQAALTGSDSADKSLPGLRDAVAEQAGQFADDAAGKGQQFADAARGHVDNLKQTVASSGEQVKDVAKEQAVRVAGEAGTQFREVIDEGMREVRAQAGVQQERLAAAVESLVSELGTMAHRAADSGQSGPLTALAQQASDRGDELVGWLQGRQPEELLDELRGYARRHPWMFLAGAAAAGVLAGRLTRGLLEDESDDQGAATAAGAPAHAAIDLRAATEASDPAAGEPGGPVTVYTPHQEAELAPGEFGSGLGPAEYLDEGARR